MRRLRPATLRAIGSTRRVRLRTYVLDRQTKLQASNLEKQTTPRERVFIAAERLFVTTTVGTAAIWRFHSHRGFSPVIRR